MNQENQKHKKEKIEKQSEENLIKDVRSLFWVFKGNEAIKDKKNRKYQKVNLF